MSEMRGRRFNFRLRPASAEEQELGGLVRSAVSIDQATAEARAERMREMIDACFQFANGDRRWIENRAWQRTLLSLGALEREFRGPEDGKQLRMVLGERSGQ